MRELVTGTHHFRTEDFEKQRELFERLAEGQAPSTLFITCSDSRIVPDLVTQTGPADLFVLRTAGNIIPPYAATNRGEAATIELAVSALNVSHIVLCGHSGCGAMKRLPDSDSVKKMPAVRARLQRGAITLHGWVYMIETFDVFSYTADQKKFVSIVKSEGVPLMAARTS